MDEIIKGLQWIKENQSYGVSGACDDLIDKCKKLSTNTRKPPLKRRIIAERCTKF